MTNGGAFWKKLVGQNAMSTDDYLWKSWPTINYKFKKVFESDSFVSLWRKMFVLKLKNDQMWQKLVRQSTKLEGQAWKLVWQLPHQLYRKLHLWIDCCWCWQVSILVHTPSITMTKQVKVQHRLSSRLPLISVSFLAFLCITSIWWFCSSTFPDFAFKHLSTKSKHPNFVFILTDDQDITLHGMVNMNLYLNTLSQCIHLSNICTCMWHCYFCENCSHFSCHFNFTFVCQHQHFFFTLTKLI